MDAKGFTTHSVNLRRTIFNTLLITHAKFFLCIWQKVSDIVYKYLSVMYFYLLYSWLYSVGGNCNYTHFLRDMHMKKIPVGRIYLKSRLYDLLDFFDLYVQIILMT